MSDEEALKKLRDRDRELAAQRERLQAAERKQQAVRQQEHAQKLSELVRLPDVAAEPAKPVAPRVAPPARTTPVRDELTHMRQWRDSLQRFAPIAKWEQAWTAKPGDPNWRATLAVQDWIEGGCKKHLVLIGAVGCGKSVAAATAVKRWVEPGESMVPVSWLDADEVVGAVCHAYDEHSKRLHKHVVVDDMGYEKKPEFPYAMRKLLDRQITLVVTSNLALRHSDPEKTFRGRYEHEPRLLSQLADLCTVVVVPGGDRRSNPSGF